MELQPHFFEEFYIRCKDHKLNVTLSKSFNAETKIESIFVTADAPVNNEAANSAKPSKSGIKHKSKSVKLKDRKRLDLFILNKKGKAKKSKDTSSHPPSPNKKVTTYCTSNLEPKMMKEQVEVEVENTRITHFPPIHILDWGEGVIESTNPPCEERVNTHSNILHSKQNLQIKQNIPTLQSTEITYSPATALSNNVNGSVCENFNTLALLTLHAKRGAIMKKPTEDRSMINGHGNVTEPTEPPSTPECLNGDDKQLNKEEMEMKKMIDSINAMFEKMDKSFDNLSEISKKNDEISKKNQEWLDGPKWTDKYNIPDITSNTRDTHNLASKQVETCTTITIPTSNRFEIFGNSSSTEFKKK